MKRILGLGITLALTASSLMPSSAIARPQKADRKTQVAAASRLDPTRTPNRVPGEVVVRYKNATDATERAELREEVASRGTERLALARTEVLEVPNGTVDDAIAELESSPDVAFAEPNFYYQAALTPNDSRYSQEWGLHNTGQSIAGSSGTSDADIDAPEAWEQTTGDPNVVVAIIDTGVDRNHPDLQSNMWTNAGESGGGKETNGVDDDSNGKVDDWRGWDFVDGDNNPSDLYGHGTHVAGTVGASGNDGQGITGVAWDVSLMSLRVLDAEGSGSTSDVASAIAYAASKGADVINLSLGGPDFSLSVSNAISAASNSLVAAAAGNAGQNVDLGTTPSYPCNYELANIVCVGATDYNDNLAGYSNYGALKVDLAAPGSRVLSAVPPFQRPLRETFETDIAGRWIAGGVGTQWSQTSDSFGGFVTDSAGGLYQANTDSWLAMAAPVSLAGQESCRLSYAFSLDTENNGDFLDVEGSTDGTNWSFIGGWTGSTGGDWLSGGHDISAFDGGPTYIRFRLRSNALLEYDGASVDQVEVRCLGTTYSGGEYSYFSGTSMATPHVAGAAALIISAAPASTIAEVRNALLNGTDQLNSLATKVATGGRLNAAKALGLLVSSGEPLPEVTPLPGGGGGGSGGSPAPTTSPSPTPTATTTPEPEPTITPIDPPIGIDHERQVGFRLRGHLRIEGQLSVADGFTSCLANVVVKIKRNGRLLKSVTTDGAGVFVTRLRDREGRYVVRAPGFDVPEGRCLGTTSTVRRHRHR